MKLPRERKTTWLPSTEQLMAGPERAILASLDANLELAIRSLKAEHVALLPAGRRSYEPFILCAQRLHRLVADYCRVADSLLATPDRGRPGISNCDCDHDVVDDGDTPF
jgi:hypothetical protein